MCGSVFGVEPFHFLLGQFLLFLETNFLATFMAVPKDEEQDYMSRCQLASTTPGVVVSGLTEHGQ